jgi:hypothetical protein
VVGGSGCCAYRLYCLHVLQCDAPRWLPQSLLLFHPATAAPHAAAGPAPHVLLSLLSLLLLPPWQLSCCCASLHPVAMQFAAGALILLSFSVS